MLRIWDVHNAEYVQRCVGGCMLELCCQKQSMAMRCIGISEVS